MGGCGLANQRRERASSVILNLKKAVVFGCGLDA
jgi:hypothetical protein